MRGMPLRPIGISSAAATARMKTVRPLALPFWRVRASLRGRFPGVVQSSHRAGLAPVPAREDHHVSAPLVDEPSERVVRRRDDGPPPRRVRPAPVEALDEGEEIMELGPLARVNEYLVGGARLRHAQGQRSVEVPGVEEEERVHGRRPPAALRPAG